MKHPKIAQAFRTLRKLGYFAKQSWKCCAGCGYAAIPVDQRAKIVFYHYQDKQHFIKTGALWLCWVGDGEEIAQAFNDAGLIVIWDGDPTTRLLVRDDG